MEITKYDILAKEAADLMEKALKAQAHLDDLAHTPFSGGPCECGADISNEALFAGHFVISKQNRFHNWLNLGECPNSEKGKAIIAAEAD